MAETQSEPYNAKVAVGAVVMNRVESGQFADTVKGVIYQKYGEYYQFTPVANGWINKPADADSINAAKDALKGADPANGALWYYDDSTTNQFMLAKKVSVKIGHMVFAY
jgi:spore germination cell wall hydrolase CwlJ-like protein